MLPSAGALINQSSGLHGAVAGANVVRASRHVSLLSACQSIDILVQYVTFFFFEKLPVAVSILYFMKAYYTYICMSAPF